MGGLHFLDPRAQAFHAIADVEVAELPADGVLAGNVEEALGGGIPDEDRVHHVDDHDRRRQGLDHSLQPAHGRRQVELAASGQRDVRGLPGTAEHGHGHGGRRRRRPLEDAPLHVVRGEPSRPGQQRLGTPEEQKTTLDHRVVETGQDPVLEVAGEIDEGVATDQQIDVRQRRILRDVVTSEDAPATEIAPEPVGLAFPAEVLLEEARRDVLEVIAAVQGVPGGVQRVLVHVGRVDLDVEVSGAVAEVLGQEDRGRKCLLAGRATHRPQPQAS